MFKKALSWSFLGETTSKLIQPLSFIILASYLNPESFGILSAALIVVSFCQVFWESGFNKAVIQLESNFINNVKTAFTLNLLLALVLGIFLFIFSKSIAIYFFDDERVSNVLKFMTIYLFFASLSSTPLAVLQRDLQFQKIFWLKLITSGIPAIFSLILAINGYGYWSLIFGITAGQVFQAILLLLFFTDFPGISIDIKRAKELFNFGSWVALSSLFGWFFTWADSLVLGNYLGIKNLGIYRSGNQFASFFFILLFAPISPVIYSFFSRVQGNKKMFKILIDNVLEILTIISIPVSIWLFFNAQNIQSFLFSKDWVNLGFVIAYMSLMHGYSWIVGMNSDFYRAFGKPKLDTIISGSFILIYLLIYMLIINGGLKYFVVGRLALALVALIFHLILLWIVFKINIFKIFKLILIITSVSFLIFYLWGSIIKLQSDIFQLIINTIPLIFMLFGLFFLHKKSVLIFLDQKTNS